MIYTRKVVAELADKTQYIIYLKIRGNEKIKAMSS